MEIISGMIKRDDYKIGDSLYKHKWCCLEDKGKYYFIDPFFVLGDIKDDDKFEINLKLFYFLCPTNFLMRIIGLMMINSKKQLNN